MRARDEQKQNNAINSKYYSKKIVTLLSFGCCTKYMQNTDGILELIQPGKYILR